MQIIQRVIAAILGLVALVAAFVFAWVVLIVVLVLGLALWGWVAWRTRKGLAPFPGVARAARRGDGAVVEGEFREVRETQVLVERQDPHPPR